MARSVRKINPKQEKIEDILGLIDLATVEEIKQSSGSFVTIEDVLRKYKGYVRVLWKDDVKDYIDTYVRNGIGSIDTETNNSVDYITASIVGVCLYTPFTRPVYIPVLHKDVTGQLVENQISLEDLKEQLSRLKACKNVYHNAAFDVNVIRTNCGITLPIYWDTMIVAKVLDENIRTAALKARYKEDVEPAQPFYNIKKYFDDNETAEISKFALYSAMDPYETFQLYLRQKKILEAPSMSRLKSLVTNVELKITEICADMEYEGAYFDKDLCEHYRDKYSELVVKKREEVDKYFLPIKEKVKEWPINLVSSDQLIEAFSYLGLNLEDTREPTLSALSEKYPIMKTILEYRSNNHMVTSFFDPLLKKINSKSKRIHASFNQLGSEDKTIKTGRFSCTDPNLQQLPAFDDSVRLCFSAAPGNLIMGADYSQQEPRLLSSLTNEQQLIDGYNLRSEEFPKGKDYYAQLASAAFNRDYWDCTEFRKPTRVEEFLEVVPEGSYVELATGMTVQAKNLKVYDVITTDSGPYIITKLDQTSDGLVFDGKKVKTIRYEPGAYNAEGKKYRSKAKGIQLGLTYGMGAARLAGTLEVEFNEAEKILNDFFSTYQSVKHWREFNMNKLQTYGFMETPLGRRRRLPDIFLPPIVIKVYDDVKVENIFPNVTESFIKVYNEDLSKSETERFNNLDFKKRMKLCESMKQAGYEVINNGSFISKTNTQCTNSVIQGGAADMTKLAMIEIFNSPILKKYGAKLRFLVHDEVLIECPIVHRKEVEKEFLDCMIRAPKRICKVSMACDAEIETRWKLGHLCLDIIKAFKKFNEDFTYQESCSKLFELYKEYNSDDLKKIIEGQFDPQTEVLRAR